MNIGRSTLKLFFGNVGSTLLSLVGFVLFARELGPSGFGVVVLFQSLVNVIVFASDVGFGSAVQKRISEGENAPAYFTAGLLVKGALFAVTGVMLLAFSGRIDAYVGVEVTLLLVVGLVLQGMGSLMVNVLRGELRVGATAVFGPTTTLCWVVVGGALVLAGFGPRGAIYGWLVGAAVKLVWSASRRSTPLGRPSLAHVRSLFAFAKYDFVGGVGAHVFNWLDVLVIGWFLTQSAVGTYEVGWRVAGITLLLSQALRSTVFPQVSEWHAAGETERIEGLINDLVTPSLFLVVPALAGVTLLARPILTLVFGAGYAGGATVVVILTAMKLFSAVHLLLVPCLLGLDRPDLNARATLVAVVVNLVLNVVLVLEFGVVGAAVATTVALVVNLALTAGYLSRFVTIRFPTRDVGWCVLAALVMAGAVHTVTRVYAVDTLPRLVGVVAFGAAVYCCIVLASRELREQIVDGVDSVLA